MQLTDTKCPNCGAPLNVFSSSGRAFCDSCGSNYMVENPQIAISPESLSTDNPVSIKFVRDEVECLTIVEEDTYENWTLVRPDYLEGYLGLIAGLSYCLRKNYKVEIVNPRFITDFRLEKCSASVIAKRKPTYDGSYVDRVDWNTLIEKGKGVYDLLSWFSDHGILAEHTENEKRDERPSGDIAYYKEHYIKVNSIITPFFFEKHFQKVFNIYNRIADRKEVDLMADKVLLIINQNETAISHSVSFHASGFTVDQCDIYFSEFGMDVSPNDETTTAIIIAIISKVILLSKKDNRYTYDINGWRSINYPNSASDSRALVISERGLYAKTKFGGLFDLKLIEKPVKQYNPW